MCTKFCGCCLFWFKRFCFISFIYNFVFQTMDYSPWSQKIELAQNILCNYSLIRYAFAPSLVGLASLVLEILLLFVLLQNSLSNHGVKK